jgi:hypothetical protein
MVQLEAHVSKLLSERLWAKGRAPLVCVYVRPPLDTHGADHGLGVDLVLPVT